MDETFMLISSSQRSSQNKGILPNCVIVVINAETYASFQKILPTFIRPTGNSIYKIYDALGIKLWTRLQLDFSHPSEHKLRHIFADSLNPSCSFSLETESTLHFLPRCQNFIILCRALKTDLKNIYDAITSLNENGLLHVGLQGNKNVKNSLNICILTATIKFFKVSEWFD